MSDNEHTNGHVRPIPLVPAEPNDIRVVDDQFDTPEAILRLLIGGMLIGMDELQSRLRRWEATERTAYEETPSQIESASIHYAVTGLMFETEARMRQRFSMLRARLARMSDEAEYLFTTTVAPALHRTPLHPVLMRLDEALFVAADAVDRWKARGWLEEQQGRRTARRATVSVVDELLDYMAHNPEVRHLIEQQGMSVAGEAVTEVRERTASADLWIERLARSLLRRSASEVPAAPATAGTQDARPADSKGG